MAKIFVIEESGEWRNLLSKALSEGHTLTIWSDGMDMETALKENGSDAVILDLQIDSQDPFAILDRLRTEVPNVPVIVTSKDENAQLVVKAVKHGAFEFLPKPYAKDRMVRVIEQALENRSLKNEIDYLRHEQDVIYSFDRIIARSPSMQQVIATLKKFAQTDGTILITGETGTGKSFLSGAIHFNSGRRKKPFIKINCTNIPETLLESELFGHERGAFTGANKTRVGRFEQANGGSAFLDEIGEMTLDLQAKLLRVLDEKSFERIGGNRTIHSDLRVITATNKPLEQQVAAGKFREDLYYRINVLTVHLPPLRERKACIEPLSKYLLQKSCRSLRKEINGFSPEVMGRFEAYSWPGNIRQLANTIERAVILEDTDTITEENISLLEPIVSSRTEEGPTADDLAPSAPIQPLSEHEKDLIIKTLEETLWIQKDAAEKLGISPRALNYKIRKLGITHPRWRKNK